MSASCTFSSPARSAATSSAASAVAGEYRIRAATPADAAALYGFGETLLAETSFLLRAPGERARSVEEMRQIICRFREDPRHLIVNAWHGDRPVGEAVLIAGGFRRNRHAGVVGVGVLRAHYGLGLGRRLMQAVEDHARAHGCHRLELTVMAQNDRARALYVAMGYEVEGRKRDSLTIDGVYVDEIMMAKLLSGAPGETGTMPGLAR